jgi:hypothetical protein
MSTQKMKAKPGDFESFERWLEKQEGVRSEIVYAAFLQAKAGLLGKSCPCGEPAECVRSVQPVKTWPEESYCFCKRHAATVDAFHELMHVLLGNP